MGSLIKKTLRKVGVKTGSERYTGIDPYAKKPQTQATKPGEKSPGRPGRGNRMGGVRSPLGSPQ